MTSKTLKKYKAEIDPFAKLYAEIETRIENADGKKLAYWLKCCNAVSETNCWWATYRAAEIIKPLIVAEQRRRKYQTKRIRSNQVSTTKTHST